MPLIATSVAKERTHYRSKCWSFIGKITGLEVRSFNRTEFRFQIQHHQDSAETNKLANHHAKL